MIELALQTALRSGTTPESLTRDLGITVYDHPTLPLVGFKYSQIDSPKLHPVVRECRGVVLERGTWNLVAKAFNRFFNVGEDAEDFAKFDWSDFSCESKEDGSLILLYHYAGTWHVNTSGSFAFGPVQGYGMSWVDLFWTTSGIDRSVLAGQEATTFVFELCTPYNKVVRRYADQKTYLLSAFEAGQEVARGTLQDLRLRLFGANNVHGPDVYDFRSKEEIALFLRTQEDTDKTFEGVVLRDSTGRRYKWKTSTYVALHQLKDNGNVLLPKRIVPLVLAGEVDEVVATLPETKSALYEARDMLAGAFADVLARWQDTRGLPTQKEFAMAVKDHPLSGLLFDMRKRYPQGGEEVLKALWRGSADILVKKLFAEKSFEFDRVA